MIWSSLDGFSPHSQLLHLVFGLDYLSSSECHKDPALNPSLTRSGYYSIAPQVVPLSILTRKPQTLPTHTDRDFPALSICSTYPKIDHPPIRKGLRETVNFQQTNCPVKREDDKMAGLYKILKVHARACLLELPAETKIFLVFHNSLLRPYSEATACGLNEN
jgi:hypothetical protein